MTSGTIDEETGLAEFERYRRYLFAIAYRMLGSVMEAEDAVQDAFLRYSATGASLVREPKAFLSTVVTRICLDRLKSARTTRETYIGPWLPEPLLHTTADAVASPEHALEQHESISMAFLVLLESLTPVERAVFLLHEVFDYGHDEVARIVGRSEPACRQLLRRARQHMRRGRPRFETTPAEQQRLVEAFVRASTSGDLDGLKSILAEDVTLWTDGGGRRGAALKPIQGADRVARFVLGSLGKDDTLTGHAIAIGAVNGRPGVILHADAAVGAAVEFETAGGRIRAIRAVLNPDKLVALRRP